MFASVRAKQNGRTALLQELSGHQSATTAWPSGSGEQLSPTSRTERSRIRLAAARSLTVSWLRSGMCLRRYAARASVMAGVSR
jgi:hypothetical protein